MARFSLMLRARVTAPVLVFLLCALAATPARAVFSSDGATRDLDAIGKSITRQPVDPRIAAALRQISAARIQQTINKLVSFRTRNTLSSMETDLPQGQGITAAADWIADQFQSLSQACGGCLEVKRDTFVEPVHTGQHSRVTRPTTITNVYAILRGTDPAQANRLLLVTGHYDSRNTNVMDDHGLAPGANDDASGVAVSLECARVLSRQKFPATLVFAAVAGEEQGLYGSAHLAKLAKDEGWQVEGVLNNDIVGGNTTPGDRLQNKSVVRVFSEGIPVTATPDQVKRLLFFGYDSDSPSRELARAIANVSSTYTTYSAAKSAALKPILEFRADRFLRGGDHSSFNKEGFPAVRFTEWREDYHHQHQNVRVEDGIQYGDLPQFVDYRYVARVARINAATIAVLASAPPPPVDAKILASKLDNNSTLEWTAGPGAPPDTRYEVVWRELTAPTWQRFTGHGIRLQNSGFTVTLPISKDNVIFGIRSVDPAGHTSPAVVPMPVR